MRTPALTPLLILTALPLVPAAATNPDTPDPPPPLVAVPSQEPNTAEPICRGDLLSCLSDATRARNGCIATCRPQRDEALRLCGEDADASPSVACTDAQVDYETCTDPCETRFRAALSALHPPPTDTRTEAATTRAQPMWLKLAKERPARGNDGNGPPPAAALPATTQPHLRPAPISRFDRLIVHHAKAEGFDWRLIAALIFEESRFDPTSRSPRGAVGLMQVRPIAAEAVGAAHFNAPDDNLRTGVRYLRYLDRMFQDARGRDRLGLMLAAYNMGPGHVRDAQILARRFGYDPNRWDDAMDQVLPLLEHPRLYTQVANGFAKGRETVNYVQRTLARYRAYQDQAAANLDADRVSPFAPAAKDGRGSSARQIASGR
jgi:soluble lytic murein transglycosylase-like protein